MEYPEIEEGTKPRHRFMSAFEQKKEPCDRKYQYLMFAAEPYEVISFKVPNMDIEKNEVFFTHWWAHSPFSGTFAREGVFSTQAWATDQLSSVLC